MEKDLFELMSKMYIEMQNGFSHVNTRLDRLETKIDRLSNKISELEVSIAGLNNSIGSLKTEIKKTNSLIGHELDPSVKTLFNGYKQNTEAINKLNDTVKLLTISINNLSVLTLQNENNIIAFSKKNRYNV